MISICDGTISHFGIYKAVLSSSVFVFCGGEARKNKSSAASTPGPPLEPTELTPLSQQLLYCKLNDLLSFLTYYHLSGHS
jgi:hypothetical protein